MRIRMPSAVIGEVLKAGIRAILIAFAIEVGLLILAFGVGIGVWVAKGFLSGFLVGFMTYAVGQIVVLMIIDMTLLLDGRPDESNVDESDEKVLSELRKELEQSVDQVGEGKPVVGSQAYLEPTERSLPESEGRSR